MIALSFASVLSQRHVSVPKLSMCSRLHSTILSRKKTSLSSQPNVTRVWQVPSVSSGKLGNGGRKWDTDGVATSPHHPHSVSNKAAHSKSRTPQQPAGSSNSPGDWLADEPASSSHRLPKYAEPVRSHGELADDSLAADVKLATAKPASNGDWLAGDTAAAATGKLPRSKSSRSKSSATASANEDWLAGEASTAAAQASGTASAYLAIVHDEWVPDAASPTATSANPTASAPASSKRHRQKPAPQNTNAATAAQQTHEPRKPRSLSSSNATPLGPRSSQPPARSSDATKSQGDNTQSLAHQPSGLPNGHVFRAQSATRGDRSSANSDSTDKKNNNSRPNGNTVRSPNAWWRLLELLVWLMSRLFVDVGCTASDCLVHTRAKCGI